MNARTERRLVAAWLVIWPIAVAVVLFLMALN